MAFVGGRSPNERPPTPSSATAAANGVRTQAVHGDSFAGSVHPRGPRRAPIRADTCGPAPAPVFAPGRTWGSTCLHEDTGEYVISKETIEALFKVAPEAAVVYGAAALRFGEFKGGDIEGRRLEFGAYNMVMTNCRVVE